MCLLTQERLQDFRACTYRTLPGQRLKSADEAVDYVDERGFVFFWPIKNVTLPSLWTATAGDRPVADEHDDPGHITWQWKDNLLGKRRWYYARVLRKRNTIISLAALPHFYALSPNFGDPESDYLDQYQAGVLTLEARLVYEALLHEGALDTLALRRAARLTSSASAASFNRALDTLQIELKVLPVGVSQAGSWHYAFIYDLTSRHYPDLQEKARPISEPQARRRLAELYLRSVGAARLKEVNALFGWRPEDTRRTLEGLTASGILTAGVQYADQGNDWYALNELMA